MFISPLLNQIVMKDPFEDLRKKVITAIIISTGLVAVKAFTRDEEEDEISDGNKDVSDIIVDVINGKYNKDPFVLKNK